MSLEQAIQENTAALKALVVAIGSAFAASAMATATLGEGGATTKKADAKKTEAKKDEPKAVTWKETLEKIKELNGSKKEGHGRPAIEALIAKFGKVGDKVPSLEAVNKHAEILAYVTSILEAEPADDDLGL